MISTPLPFEYPEKCHVRRHGPDGYTQCGSYREWLRDEFCFRCVYCLAREKWIVLLQNFHIDHFIPRATNPLRELEYDNLVYACSRCNLAKQAVLVDDPCEIAFGDCLKVHSDGVVEGRNPVGKRLIETLGLNFKETVKFRRLWLQIFSNVGSELRTDLLGFPDDLPDLRSKKPPLNRRPTGIENCYFEQRKNGTIASVY